MCDELIWTRPIDVLLIDGDHSYEGCAGDLVRFAPYVSLGGILMIDDFHLPYKDVLRSWEDYPSKGLFEPIEQVGKLALFRRSRANDEGSKTP